MTTEPDGKRKTAASRQLRFVVHKHAAMRLLCDLRLELAGAFKCWAVAKGPSQNPSDKRIAAEVEEHPLAMVTSRAPSRTVSGGGTVMIWDRGLWSTDSDIDAAKALRNGELRFILAGEKLQGGWVLVRIRRDRDGNKRKNWLMINHRDGYERERDFGCSIEAGHVGSFRPKHGPDFSGSWADPKYRL